MDVEEEEEVAEGSPFVDRFSSSPSSDCKGGEGSLECAGEGEALNPGEGGVANRVTAGESEGESPGVTARRPPLSIEPPSTLLRVSSETARLLFSSEGDPKGFNPTAIIKASSSISAPAARVNSPPEDEGMTDGVLSELATSKEPRLPNKKRNI